MNKIAHLLNDFVLFAIYFLNDFLRFFIYFLTDVARFGKEFLEDSITALTIIIKFYNELLFSSFLIFWKVAENIHYWHWHHRKHFHTFVCHYHAYYGFKLWKRRYLWIHYECYYKIFLKYTYITSVFWTRILPCCVFDTIDVVWYRCWWIFWVILTYNLYFNSRVRDFGPSYDVFDYHWEIQMGYYLTMGNVLTFIWIVWTISADQCFMASIYFLMFKLFIILKTWYFWYALTAFFGFLKLTLSCADTLSMCADLLTLWVSLHILI